MEPCGQCESCLSFTEGRSYCIHELDAASNNSVDDIRNITDMVRIPPQIGKYSVYIIDEVHMLSSAAFNAFLKTLEEPPAHAIFILATTEKHKILPTILSRCQTYDFNRISIMDMVKNLSGIAEKEDIKIEEDALHIIAQKADGAMRDALTLFDQMVAFCGKNITYDQVITNLNVLDYEYYFRLTDFFMKGDYTGALMLLDEVLSKGFNALHFISGLSSHFRDLLVCRNHASESLLQLPPTLIKRYKDQSQYCNIPFIYSALGITTACEAAYRQSGNQRLLIEFALMKLSFITAAAPIAVSQTPASQNVPQAAPQSIPQTAPQSTPQTAPQTAPQAAPQSIPQAASQSIPQAAPQSAPQAAPQTAPQTAPQSAPQATANTIAAKAHDNDSHAASTGLSLKEMLKKAEYKSSKAASAVKSIEDKEFTTDDFNSAWKELIEREKNSGKKVLAATLLQYSPEIDENIITFYVSNAAQKQWVEEKRLLKMITFIREKLQNSKINMQVDVAPAIEGELSNLMLTPTQKGEMLLKSDEELRELKKDLDLDIK